MKKIDYNSRITDIESKYISTADYNKFTEDIVNNSIKSKNFADKSDIAGILSNADLDLELSTLAAKAKLKVEQAKIKRLKAFNLRYFEEDGAQNYLIFQPINRHYKRIIGAGNGKKDRIKCICL